jgi:hypothetical protein
MSHFIVVYDRLLGGEPSLEKFEDSDAASKRLSELEHEFRRSDGRRVVLLTADDEETLRQTHSHYFFRSVDDLLDVVRG